MAEFDFSTLVTDRTLIDLETIRGLLETPMSDWTAEQLAEFNRAIAKGSYNYTDLNRVISCLNDINEKLSKAGYVTGYQKIPVQHKEPEPQEQPGMLPDGYTRLSWIESTGTQYIDTGFEPDQNTRVILDIQATDIAICAIYGARIAPANSCFGVWQTSETEIELNYGSNTPRVTVASTTDRLTIDQNKNVLKFGDTEYTASQQTFNPGCNLTLFGINANGTIDQRRVSAKLYYCKVYNGNVLVRDFVPAKKDNISGLYDLANNQFYQNLGTGVFSEGETIDPPEPPPNPTPEKDPYVWYEDDVPTKTQMQMYLANVNAVKSALTLPQSTPNIPHDMDGLTFSEANDIEIILSVIETYFLAMQKISLNSGMAWAISGGLNFYFAK